MDSKQTGSLVAVEKPFLLEKTGRSPLPLLQLKRLFRGDPVISWMHAYIITNWAAQVSLTA